MLVSLLHSNWASSSVHFKYSLAKIRPVPASKFVILKARERKVCSRIIFLVKGYMENGRRHREE